MTTKFAVIAVFLVFASSAHAQKAPEAGYVFPPGGKAGTTIDVHLGGYDWTPDMEFFVHDKRVQLVPGGTPGPILIPGPPYWFGAKGRLPSMPLPREVPAKLTIPADVAPGPMLWQAANANGCTSVCTFLVGAGPEVVEDENRTVPQRLASLPMTVNGRLMKNEEVDRYRFVAPRTGPITCELLARRLGAKFHAILEVRDSKGQPLADALGTSSTDPSLTFAAKAGAEYEVCLHDIDFGGDRAYVYRLTVTPGPGVVGALPAAGRHGETRQVEFVGIGVATGNAQLESVVRSVTFPAAGAALEYRLETPLGAAPPFRLLVSDVPESGQSATLANGPFAISGVLDREGAEGQHAFAWKKGDAWSLTLEARRLGSPLDVALAILAPDGKEVARNDDLPDTTDAGLDFTVPADGTYKVVVSDMAGKSGSRAAIYRLLARPSTPDFALSLAAQRAAVPLGGKFDLTVNAIRKGGFKGPIALNVRGLPPGISVPPSLVIAADKSSLVIPLQGAPDAAVAAGLVTVEGTAPLGTQTVTRTALARSAANLAPRSPEENQLSSLLVVGIMKARFKGRPVDQDTGRKVHRGSTFPAEVLIERLDGFQGEIVLHMAAQQSYQVQGITGGDVLVPPGVTKTIYPCFMPEWLETTRTSRMGMVALARVPDPKGKVRYLMNEITGFVTMTMEGALLKVSADEQDLVVTPGQPFTVHVKVSRLTKLAGPVRLELQVPKELKGMLAAEPMVMGADRKEATFRITPAPALRGRHVFTIRGTALQEDKYLVVSEAGVSADFQPGASSTPNE